MKATVKIFSREGDSTLMEYDTETADMAEVNRAIDTYEKQVGGRAFNWQTGEAVAVVTPDVQEVMIVRPIVGG